MAGERNTIGCLFGPKGSGKSYLLEEIIREHRPRRVVILDYVGEHGRAQVGAEEAWGLEQSLRALERASRAKEFVISCRDLYDEDRLDLLHVAFELENYLLVVEEAPTVCGPGVMPTELQRIIAIGRHQRISQAYVAQRPYLVNRLVTSQSDYIVAFRQVEDRDVEYLVKTCGQAMERVRELEQYAIVVAGSAPERAPRAVRRRIR